MYTSSTVPSTVWELGFGLFITLHCICHRTMASRKHASNAGSGKTKLKHSSLGVMKKIKMLNKSKCGACVVDMARAYGLNEASVHMIKNSEVNIWACAINNPGCRLIYWMTNWQTWFTDLIDLKDLTDLTWLIYWLDWLIYWMTYWMTWLINWLNLLTWLTYWLGWFI